MNRLSNLRLCKRNIYFSFFQYLFISLQSKKYYMKRLLFVIGGVLLMIGCETCDISTKLTKVDSLVIKEEYDSAYQIVLSIDETKIINQKDLAHYNLLKVQTSYLVNKPVVSADSLLDKVIDYYKKYHISDKLADAHYYKAIGLYLHNDIPQSIIHYKRAEKLANQSGNLYQQHKVAEGICFVNRQCANYHLELDYAKKALELANKLKDKKRIVYAYYELNLAYHNLGLEDSSKIILSKISPLILHVNKNVLPHLLSNLGYMLLDYNTTEAKRYFIQALSYKEMTGAYEHLAEIVYDEGKTEEAYQYWKKALAVPDQSPKDIIIRNLIEYNLERGKTDSISDMVAQIFEICDSIDAKLKDDTIKDMQTRFDHEIALKEKDRVFVRGILIMTIVIFVLIGGFSVIYFRRRHLAKLQMLDYQMQINDNLRQIEILKASGTDTKQEVDRLNKLIEDIMQNKVPKLDRGRMLYDDIINGNITMIDWNREHEQMFLDYYTATHYDTVQKMKNVKRVEKLTPHKLFYLILVKLGKTDEQIQQMMSVSDSTLRGLKHRTKPL